MIFIISLLQLIISYRNHKPSNNPLCSYHSYFSPLSDSLSSTFKSKDFNENDNHTDNHTSFAILLRRYSRIAPQISSDDSIPPIYSNVTEVNITTLQKFYRYYELLQILQSPYVSQQKKIETIQREQDIFSTSSITPKIWSGLDW
jgi:hypothetical protein